MNRDKLVDDYFEWLCDTVGNTDDYRRLLMRLHSIEFRYLIPRDQNCAEHGVYLRYRFAGRDSEYITGPCSVLEMMVALALNCEEDIMDDPAMGDRTTQWFWKMVVNLGLGSMYDAKYDRDFVDKVVERFLNRDYEPDGRGGLFTVRNCNRDMRDMEIWNQMSFYINTIT
jgi:hypothetical protein